MEKATINATANQVILVNPLTNFSMLRRRSPPPGFATLQNSKNRLDIAAQVQTLFAVVQRHKK